MQTSEEFFFWAICRSMLHLILLKFGLIKSFFKLILKILLLNIAGVPPDYFNMEGSFGVILYTIGKNMKKKNTLGGSIV